MKYRAPWFMMLASSIAALACGGGSATPGPGGDGGASSTGSGSSSSGQGGGSASGGLPCDVEDILVDNCQKCHSNPPVFGAPMPLVTYADLQAPSKLDPAQKVYERVSKRIHDAAAPMPQPPNAPLGASDLKVMDDWIAAGAPASSTTCGGGAGGSGAGGAGGGEPGVSCAPDLIIKPSQAWVMPKNTGDQYVCYGFDFTPQQATQITALVPRVDNKTIVHHILLFQADSSSSGVPTACPGGAFGGRLLAVWAPGGGPMELPPEVGLPITGTQHFLVQIHYSNLTHLDGQTDETGYDLCTTTNLRPNDGDILAFGSMKFNIPAAGKLDITCDFDIPGILPAKKVIYGMPHMHTIGTKISTTVLPGGNGAPVDLGTRDPWSFDAQYWTPLDVTIKGGDKVRTRCAWENPGASPVGFGEKTNDEMCYGFVFYYPKITQAFNWATPAGASTCVNTP